MKRRFRIAPLTPIASPSPHAETRNDAFLNAAISDISDLELRAKDSKARTTISDRAPQTKNGGHHDRRL
jgi:hypothetical protein